MKGIVERFEGEIAIIEIDRITNDVSRTHVNEKVKVGDSVEFINGKWETNKDETAKRNQKIKKLMNDVWED